MVNELNHLLDGLKTVLTAGFTLAGRQYFGTSGAGIFQITDYDGTTKSFDVVNKMKNVGQDAVLAPYIYVHQFSTNPTDSVGGYVHTYDVGIMLVFTEQHAKTVESVSVSEDELARYFLTELTDGFQHLSGRAIGVVPGVRVTILPGQSQSGHIDSNIYGATLRIRASFR